MKPLSESGIKKPSPLLFAIILLAALLLVGCICLSVAGGGYYLLFNPHYTQIDVDELDSAAADMSPTAADLNQPTKAVKSTATQIPEADNPTPGSRPTSVTPGSAPGLQAELAQVTTPEENLQLIRDTQVSASDLLDLIARLHGIKGVPRVLEMPAEPLQAGSQQSFWAMNSDNDKNFTVHATLQYVTDHLYFWVEDGVSYNQRALQKLADAFENKIYPTNRSFFGNEWTPGVDGDPRLHILYASGLGSGIAGYFSSADEYPPQANEYSNAKELFLVNADTTNLARKFTYTVLAHEFQHMIHWYRDRNEDSWLNEGFSELAAFLNGYGGSNFSYSYTIDPDIQLTDWPDDDPAHYGAAFLFLTYFLDRFGEQATQSLVANPENGMESIDQVLSELGVKDPISGQVINADDVFADWAVALYLRDRRAGDGRFTYYNYPQAPKPDATEEIRNCAPSDQDISPENRQTHQYGVDYIRIRCPGKYTLHFEGSPEVNLLPIQPYSGASYFWSNQGDESDMTLTQTFDFTNYSGPLTLDYSTWYDIESDYDYVYLLASTDGGETWQILTTPSGTAEDPTGNSFGWGYTGMSGNQDQSPEWIQESVDLSRFAGQQVLLRFEYITDSAANKAGFALDDITIPQIGYFSDFESGDGGWEPQGFVNVQNILPQIFRLSLIKKGKTSQVEQFTLMGDNTLDIPVEIGQEFNEVILVVSGTTRITRENASYRFQIIPN